MAECFLSHRLEGPRMDRNPRPVRFPRCVRLRIRQRNGPRSFHEHRDGRGPFFPDCAPVPLPGALVRVVAFG
jgi:hypothetical protein